MNCRVTPGGIRGQELPASVVAVAVSLVDFRSDDKMEIVVQEILQDKIFLDATNQVVTAADHRPMGGPPEYDLSSL